MSNKRRVFRLLCVSLLLVLCVGVAYVLAPDGLRRTAEVVGNWCGGKREGPALKIGKPGDYLLPGSMDGGQLAYLRLRAENETILYLYDINTGQTTSVNLSEVGWPLMSANRIQPQMPWEYEHGIYAEATSISGGRIVWKVEVPDSNGSVYLWDLKAQTGRFLNPVKGEAQEDPLICGEHVVWVGNRYEDIGQEVRGFFGTGIFLYDLAKGSMTRLDSRPELTAIAPGAVAWLGYTDDGYGYLIKVYDITTATTTPVPIGEEVESYFGAGGVSGIAVDAQHVAYIQSSSRSTQHGWPPGLCIDPPPPTLPAEDLHLYDLSAKKDTVFAEDVDPTPPCLADGLLAWVQRQWAKGGRAAYTVHCANLKTGRTWTAVGPVTCSRPPYVSLSPDGLAWMQPDEEEPRSQQIYFRRLPHWMR